MGICVECKASEARVCFYHYARSNNLDDERDVEIDDLQERIRKMETQTWRRRADAPVATDPVPPLNERCLPGAVVAIPSHERRYTAAQVADAIRWVNGLEAPDVYWSSVDVFIESVAKALEVAGGTA